METELAKFEADPASTPEQCDALLRLLLQLHPANDVRWKAIQAAWKRCSTVEKSTQWLKNRAKKIQAEESKPPKVSASAAPGTADAERSASQSTRPNESSDAATDQDRALRDLILMALDHQLEHGGSGASGEGLMGALAQSFGDSFDDHALYTACEFGRLRNVEQLKKVNGIDVNFRYKDGSTPLLIATKNKHIDVCKALVAMEGIDLNCRWVGRGCDTPLILAVEAGAEELAASLLSKHAAVDHQNSIGNTALHLAAGSGNDRISELLLAAAASTNVQNRKGATALQVATEAAHKDVMKLLVEVAQSAPTGSIEAARSDDDADSAVAAIRTLVERHLQCHKIASAHSCAAEWAAEADGRAEFGWHLQQLCFRKSPFVWQYHQGLHVEKCTHGFGMKTRLPIQPQEPVLAECAAVPWTLTEVRDPVWVSNYLDGSVQGLHTLAEHETITHSALLEGLWPRSSADFEEALATFPEAVQLLIANAGNSAREPIAIARSSCNSHHDGTHLSVAFFNHSCSPNCEIRGRYHVQLYATRDIAAGEELTIPYFRFTNLLQAQPIRSKIFQDTWGSACACPRCVSGTGEVQDDSFYAQINTIQHQLHAASTPSFLPMALQLLQGDVLEVSEPWRSNLTHLVLQDAVERRLQQSEWQAFMISSQRDGLIRLLEALLVAFSNQREIVGDSKQLKPICQTISQLESLRRHAGGSLPDEVAASLQQVHSLQQALLGT